MIFGFSSIFVISSQDVQIFLLFHFQFDIIHIHPKHLPLGIHYAVLKFMAFHMEIVIIKFIFGFPCIVNSIQAARYDFQTP